MNPQPPELKQALSGLFDEALQQDAAEEALSKEERLQASPLLQGLQSSERYEKRALLGQGSIYSLVWIDSPCPVKR